MKPSRAGRPVWTQGMLVCPQHMQQQDLYHEQSLDARIRYVSPAPWGVSSISIDLAELQSGSIQLSSFRGVLPDGTIAEFDLRSEARPAARSISSSDLPPARKSLSLYLGIKLLQESVANVSKDEDPIERRYRSNSRPVYDLVTARDREIHVCVPHFTLLLETDRRDEYSTLKIAEIVRSESGHFSLSESYIPPLLAIQGSPVLASALRDLVSQLIARRRGLVDEQVSQGRLRSVRQSDLYKALFIQALDTSLPLLRGGIRDDTTPPHVIHQALGQLCGALCYPTGHGDPTNFPTYSHQDLRSSFEPLLALAQHQVRKQFAQTFIEFELVRTATHWLAQDQGLALCPELYVAVRAEGERATVKEAILAGTKAASLGRLKLILPTAAPGIALEPVASPPAGIPVIEDEMFFRLDPDSSLYHEAMVAGEIAVFIRKPYDPSTTRLRLLGLTRDGAAL